MTRTSDPYLSIVLTGRNDNYGGNFNDQLFRALAFNNEKLAERGIDHEVVFVEWSPVPGQPYLSDLLAERFPALARSALVCYIVDPRYQEVLSLNPSVQYLEYVAKNVGIRRAAGQFVLSTNTDIFLGKQVVDVCAAGSIKTGTVYRAPRFDLKLGIDQSLLTWDALADERNHVRRSSLEPPLYSGAAGDFILLDRESFFAVKGFNEVYRLARVGVDYSFLVKAHGNGLRIVDIGGAVYHVDHIGSHRSSRGLYRDRDAEAPWGDRRWHSSVASYNNPEEWGLAAAPTVEIGPRKFLIDFDWSAVPPLVELRRIVLSVRRVGQPDIEQ